MEIKPHQAIQATRDTHPGHNNVVTEVHGFGGGGV